MWVPLLAPVTLGVAPSPTLSLKPYSGRFSFLPLLRHPHQALHLSCFSSFPWYLLFLTPPAQVCFFFLLCPCSGIPPALAASLASHVSFAKGVPSFLKQIFPEAPRTPDWASSGAQGVHCRARSVWHRQSLTHMQRGLPAVSLLPNSCPIHRESRNHPICAHPNWPFLDTVGGTRGLYTVSNFLGFDYAVSHEIRQGSFKSKPWPEANMNICICSEPWWSLDFTYEVSAKSIIICLT